MEYDLINLAIAFILLVHTVALVPLFKFVIYVFF